MIVMFCQRANLLGESMLNKLNTKAGVKSTLKRRVSKPTVSDEVDEVGLLN